MSHRINTLREQRARLIARAQALIPRDRNQGISDRDSKEFDALLMQVDQLQDEINLSQPTEQHARFVSGLSTIYQTGDVASSNSSHQVRAFPNYLKFGMNV
jgi:hypothetical protein